VAHELLHGRSQELLDRMYKRGSKSYFEGFKGVGITMESYGKVEISYINVDNF
jgi:hypothetical protein